MTAASPRREGKRGLRDALAAEASAEIGRLAAEAARSLGCDAGLEAAEAVIRAGMLKLGGGMLGKLLAADPGHRGPRVPCGQGHEAEFAAYRDKVIDTVLGPVTVSRAWYHCADLRARPGAPGRRTRRRRAVDVAGAGRDERPGGRSRAVREGGRTAGRPGRGPPDSQARRARCRGQRHREGRGSPGPGRADHRPQARPAAAVPAAGQALCRDRRHRRPGDREGGRRPGRQGRGRARPHPRGQARRLLHPGQAR